MFLLFSAVIVVFSICTVTSRRILRAATFLLFVLVSTACLYFLLKYNFLAAIQLMLYAGGIVVLIIFSILLTSHIADLKLEVSSSLAGSSSEASSMSNAIGPKRLLAGDPSRRAKSPDVRLSSSALILTDRPL